MNALGMFWGIGVGPGPAGMLPVAAAEALKSADLVFVPRARGSELSVARQCVADLDLAPDRLRDAPFDLELERSELGSHYAALAGAIARELRAGRNVAYLTIGDSMTYSTYGYLLSALTQLLPGLSHRTFPGITSYAAAAAALGWSLGEGKERMLILPCPDQPDRLRRDIATHDIVVLMKIGDRLPWVLQLLRELGIAEHCAFARRIGLPDELLSRDVGALAAGEAMGYLSILLIRKYAKGKRHA